MTALPSLGLISHGTSSTEGRALIEVLATAVGEDLRASGLVGEVMLGHVDVQEPDVAEVLDRLPHERPVVLVPLLLSPGFHVHVDLAEAVAQAGGPARANEAEGAGGDGAGVAGAPARDIRLAPTLGPDPRLATILAERLPPLRDGDEVVLAAAGSSDERANESCRQMGQLLENELGRPVEVGFHAGGGAKLTDIVEQKVTQDDDRGEWLVLANYLLAPGFFDDLARKLIEDSGSVLAPPLLALQSEAQAPDGPSAASSTTGSAPLDASIVPGDSIPDLLVDLVRDRFLSVL